MKIKTNFTAVIKDNKAEAISIVLGSIFYMFMMCYRLTFSPLWFDEYVEHEISQMSIKSGEMYTNIIRTFQPPLYNFVMHFWLRIAQDVFWFRLFNVLLGIVIGLCIYLTVRRLYGFKPATASLVLLGCCYQYIYCVQECSEYQLMVMFISLMLYFYVRTIQDECRISALLFVISGIGAMYSQYGAMFMVIPFLGLFYIKVLMSKDKKNIISLTAVYAIALFAAAAPLYLLYASKQLKENAIADHTTVSFGISQLLSLFTEPGRILGYLYNIPAVSLLSILMGVIGVIYIVTSIYISITKIKTKQYIIADILMATLLGYVLHYFLVIFQVYAMVHPGQSGGFYCRYSYFYIPAVIVCIFIIVMELKRSLIDNAGKNVKTTNCVVIGLFALVAVTLFIPNILKNWHKAYDDIFADTWVSRNGWEEPTYMIGQAKYGIKHYITEVYGPAASSNMHTELELDYNYMPASFWLWRTSWGGDGFDKICTDTASMGYDVEVIYDFGQEGQLAHISTK